MAGLANNCRSDRIWMHSDIWDNPVFKNGRATVRGAFIWLASMGRVSRVTVDDLSDAWGVTDRRAVQIVRTLERSGFISVAGSGCCRLLCIETNLVETCGFYVGARARYPREPGAAKWRGATLPAALRQTIIERDGSVCAYCGENTDTPHIDHIKPVAVGGTDSPKNLTVACPPCNLSKGRKTLAEWRGAAH